MTPREIRQQLQKNLSVIHETQHTKESLQEQLRQYEELYERVGDVIRVLGSKIRYS